MPPPACSRPHALPLSPPPIAAHSPRSSSGAGGGPAGAKARPRRIEPSREGPPDRMDAATPDPARARPRRDPLPATSMSASEGVWMTMPAGGGGCVMRGRGEEG